MLAIQAKESHHEQKKFVWPIVFCYRQYIELALKEVLAKHGEQVEPEIEPNWKSHKLGELWSDCKSIMQETLSGTTLDDVPGVRALEGLINEFQEVDMGSYSFRFPTDTTGKLVEFPFESIDLANLKSVMEGIYTFLDCNKEVLTLRFDGPYNM